MSLSEKDLLEYLETLASDLGEHFDAIQIMVSWNEDGKTYALHRGAGNWYARQGMAHEFINSDVAQGQARSLSDVLVPIKEDEDGEGWA